MKIRAVRAPSKCLAEHSARRTFVTVHKIKRRTEMIG